MCVSSNGLRVAAAAVVVLCGAAGAQVSYSASFLQPLKPIGDASVRVLTNAGVPAGVAFDGADYRPVRWVGGMPVPLTSGPSSTTYYWMNGHSGDTLVGHMRIGDGDYGFRWTPAEGLVAIMSVPGGETYSAAYGINSAGAVAGSVGFKAVRWTPTGGATIIEFPGTPGPVDYGGANAINDSGVVVGFAGHPAGTIPFDGIQAFRWTQATGIQTLVFLGGSNSWANDVNAAGDIVGTAATGDTPDDPEKGFLWKDGVVTVLGTIGDPVPSNAVAINDAGQILGFDGFAIGGTLEPWVWIGNQKIPLGGVTKLPAGWRIAQVHDMNNDGDIVATLVDDATLEQRPALLVQDPCYADCDGSGGLTVADFGCFQTRFVANDPYADCDGNGQLTVQDFGCYQTAFVAGCP